MNPLLPNADAAEHFPEVIEVVLSACEAWREDGEQWDNILDRLTMILDAALPLEALLGFPLGTALEVGDGLAIKAALEAVDDLVRELQPSPERLRERAVKAEAKGRHRVAARRYKRAAKIEQRDT